MWNVSTAPSVGHSPRSRVACYNGILVGPLSWLIRREDGFGLVVVTDWNTFGRQVLKQKVCFLPSSTAGLTGPALTCFQPHLLVSRYQRWEFVWKFRTVPVIVSCMIQKLDERTYCYTIYNLMKAISKAIMNNYKYICTMSAPPPNDFGKACKRGCQRPRS